MLSELSTRFDFTISDLNEELTVLDFEYDIALSKLYTCKVEFVSLDPNLSSNYIVNKRATLSVTLKGAASIQYVNGIVTKFIQNGKIGNSYSYEVLLEPRFTQTKHQERTEVFLNQSIPDIIEAHLKNANIRNYRLDLSQEYDARPFVCQFQESDFNFISRWLEREGIYYYFQQSNETEILILTDRFTTHKNHQDFVELAYNQENITGIPHSVNVVNQFSAEVNKVSQSLELKGYDYDDTNVIITMAEVSSNGMGRVEIYDELVMDETDAKRIAEIRAQEISCKEHVFSGTTLASNILPGYRFNLVEHYRAEYNQDYLVFSIQQSGSQRQVALSHLGLSDKNTTRDEVVLKTNFKAIPGNVQYRAPSLTTMKRIEGIIPAKLDAETSGEYAQLDTQGRYKFRFLHSDKADGQASDWVRKMESYIGKEYGSHFPLHKDTEVCIAFQFGNPDRPIIIGAVHDAKNENVVTSANQKSGVIKSASGHRLVMNDQKGQEYIKMATPNNDAMVLYGNINVITA